MSDSYVLQQAPFVVPTTDGKLIEEHVGRAVSNEPEVSVCSYGCTTWLERTTSKSRV